MPPSDGKRAGGAVRRELVIVPMQGGEGVEAGCCGDVFMMIRPLKAEN